MEVRILDITTDALYNISMAARTCYNSREKDDINKRAEFIKGLIKAGHETPLEFANVVFDIGKVSRVLTHQLVRHRIASYCQESQRYVNQSHNITIVPQTVLKDEKTKELYLDTLLDILGCYDNLISLGVPKEDARYILPEGMSTNIAVCFNFRELRHFLKLRLNKHAQWEIRELAKQMKDLMIQRGYGCIVEDIGE